MAKFKGIPRINTLPPLPPWPPSLSASPTRAVHWSQLIDKPVLLTHHYPQRPRFTLSLTLDVVRCCFGKCMMTFICHRGVIWGVPCLQTPPCSACSSTLPPAPGNHGIFLLPPQIRLFQNVRVGIAQCVAFSDGRLSRSTVHFRFLPPCVFMTRPLSRDQR